MKDNASFLERIGCIVFFMIIFYLIGVVIAWDINPLHWLLLTTVVGRILLCFIFIGIIGVGWDIPGTDIGD